MQCKEHINTLKQIILSELPRNFKIIEINATSFLTKQDLANLPITIEKFNPYFDPPLTDDDLKIITKRLKNLKCLLLCTSHKLTNKCLQYLPATITYLNLDDNDWVNDDTLKEIGQRLPNLKHLFIRSCENASEGAIKKFKENNTTCEVFTDEEVWLDDTISIDEDDTSKLKNLIISSAINRFSKSAIRFLLKN
jgi:hypothetical protein